MYFFLVSVYMTLKTINPLYEYGYTKAAIRELNEIIVVTDLAVVTDLFVYFDQYLR